MADVDTTQIERLTREMIRTATQDGTISELTPRVIRQRVEDRLSLEDGTLDAPDYKRIVKDTIRATQDELDAEEQAAQKKSAKKPAAKPKVKKEVKEAVEKPSKNSAAAKKEKNTKPKRSASVIPSSDEEDASSKSLSRAPGIAQDPKTEERPMKRQKTSEAGSSAAAPSSKVMSEPDVPMNDHSNTAAVPNADDAGADDKSDSEMSVLIDEPPKRKKKGKEQDKDVKSLKVKESKEKKPKPPVKELSKDEETIKRLKSFVVACGVRKVWAKEFKDMDKPWDQIRHLKSILSELGMDGRLSLEKAKAIRAKRELAKELEDVKDFEKTVVSGPGSSRRTRKSTQSVEDDSDEDQVPTKKRNAAHRSIMAFLDDQSDDD